MPNSIATSVPQRHLRLCHRSKLFKTKLLYNLIGEMIHKMNYLDFVLCLDFEQVNPFKGEQNPTRSFYGGGE